MAEAMDFGKTIPWRSDRNVWGVGNRFLEPVIKCN